MKRRVLLQLLLTLTVLTSAAQSTLDSIAKMLADAPVQEKIYLHLDNTCYYKGDTIWYKSYVVRADDLSYTDMSRIAYVELVSPDGLVVERQQLIVSADGYGDGNFTLKDSLYSGYYELRAYTRWMLNFCVTEHPNTRTDREQFYNRQMAHDFFRQYGTVYSRVFPVYERPDSAGDYAQKYIVSRPKTRLDKEQRERLSVHFYPEGGHLVGGTRCRVAFEALSEEGEQIEISGRLEADGRTQPIATEHQGRGCFTVDVPESGRLKAHFSYHGKDYTFDLPRTERTGCALHVDAISHALTADITLKGGQRQVGVAVLCRGVLKHFQTLTGSQRITLDKSLLPTGVCDLLVIDEEGRALADRLFFVDHHDHALQPVTVSGVEPAYEPFSPVTLQFQAPAGTKHISISVRDTATDEPTYDTGNIMTDLLLSSDLKGFIAHPDYYFEADDQEHRQRLDLLMMVQGFRRYDYAELTSQKPLRYQPEQTMTVEGAVYKTVSFDEIRDCEVPHWLTGNFGWCDEDADHLDPNDPNYAARVEGLNSTEEQTGEGGQAVESQDESFNTLQATPMNTSDPEFGVNHGGLSHEVTVEGELILEDEIGNVEMETTDGGRFAFNVPPFYGKAFLFLTAHKTNISERRQHKLETQGRLDENAWPEYYVKRDLFYPVFARKYDYYQCHQPDDGNGPSTTGDDLTGIMEEGRISKFDTQLRDIKVNARRRRGRHAIDYSKPAYAYDAYELYNLVTDYGLSFGKLNFRRFPIQVSMLLLGNYNSTRFFNVEARMSDNQRKPYTFYRNFTPDASVNTAAFRSPFDVARNLQLNRQDEIRLFTDFELRNEDRSIEQAENVADVTLDFVLMADDAKRYTYRDRRLVLNGMFESADFYSPDYSRRPLPTDGHDYRRTLYWNPNAQLDEEGRFTATLYTGSKPAHIQVSTAGVFK